MKRGQNAAGAGILLAIIAGALIFFVIVIPPAERADLLGEPTSSLNTSLEDTLPEKNFLTVSPGRLDFYDQKTLEHPLPIVTIKTEAEPQVIAQKPTVYLKKGVFSEKDATVSFNLEQLDKTTTVLMSYSEQNVDDDVTILLNNEEIFQGRLTTPLTLPKNLLQSQNILRLKVKSPGLAFWRTNEADLSGLKVVAEVTNTQAQSASHVFLISETEKKGLEKVRVRFQPNCKYGQVGKLSITINGEEIYNALPDCDLQSVPLEFSPEVLREGKNDITFRTTKGLYVLSHVMIKTSLKDIEYPTYYFEMTNEEYEEVKNNKKRVRVQVDFVDTVSRKTGQLVYNGFTRHIDTKEKTFTVDMSDDIERGTNSLKIVPKRTLEIREVRIDLLKR